MPTNSLLEFATDLALQVGDLLHKHFDLAGVPAAMKPDHSVVTKADLAADRMISDSIRSHYPQDGIISEEASHRLIGSPSSVWVIDPLDGTTNFSLGLVTWGVSIARLTGGMPELGVLYFPIIDELYTVIRTKGACLNHKPISTRAPNPSQPMSFFACCSRSFRDYDIDIPYKPRILGSAAYSFCMVARGTALLGLEVTPKLWDLAAAWLLVEEAGGKLTVLDGSSPFPISASYDYSLYSFPTLAAATPELLDHGQKKIRRKNPHTR